MSRKLASVPNIRTRSGKGYAGAAGLPEENAAIAEPLPTPMGGDDSVSIVGQFPTEQQVSSNAALAEGLAPGRAPMAFPGEVRATGTGTHLLGPVRSPRKGLSANTLPFEGSGTDDPQELRRSRAYGVGEDGSYHPVSSRGRAEERTRNAISHNPRLFDQAFMDDGDDEGQVERDMDRLDAPEFRPDVERISRRPSIASSHRSQYAEKSYLEELITNLDQDGIEYFASMVEKRRKGKKRAMPARPFNAPVSPSPPVMPLAKPAVQARPLPRVIDDDSPSSDSGDDPVPNTQGQPRSQTENNGNARAITARKNANTVVVNTNGDKGTATPDIKSTNGTDSVTIIAPPITASAQLATKTSTGPVARSVARSYASLTAPTGPSPMAPPLQQMSLPFELNQLDDSESEYTSDTSAASSDASDRTKHRKKRKRASHKRWKRKKDLLALVKPSEPEKYSGHTNYDKFNAWTFTVVNFFRTTGTPKGMRVPFMLHWLEGKALEWYMLHVRPNIMEWDTLSVMKGLFDYFFPKNYREIARAKFENAYQGNKNVRDYARYLQNLASQVHGVTDLQIRLRFHDSVSSLYRVRWAEAGYDPEFHTLEQLIEAAERFEAAENRRKHEQNRSQKADSSRKPKEERDKRTNGKSETPGRDRSRREDKPDRSKDSQARQPKKEGRQDDKDKAKRDKEKAQLRADGKCFHCKATGHLKKDCPKRNSAPAPLASAAIRIDRLETLIADRDAQTLRLSMANCDTEPESSSMPHTRNLNRAIAAVSQLNAHGSFAKLETPLLGPAPRFSMIQDPSGNSYTITDHALQEFTSTFTIHQLADPNWNAVEWYSEILRISLFSQDILDEENSLGILLSTTGRLQWITFRMDVLAPYPNDPKGTTVTPGRFIVLELIRNRFLFIDMVSRFCFEMTRSQIMNYDLDIALSYQTSRSRGDSLHSLRDQLGDLDLETMLRHLAMDPSFTGRTYNFLGRDDVPPAPDDDEADNLDSLGENFDALHISTADKGKQKQSDKENETKRVSAWGATLTTESEDESEFETLTRGNEYVPRRLRNHLTGSDEEVEPPSLTYISDSSDFEEDVASDSELQELEGQSPSESEDAAEIDHLPTESPQLLYSPPPRRMGNLRRRRSTENGEMADDESDSSRESTPTKHGQLRKRVRMLSPCKPPNDPMKNNTDNESDGDHETPVLQAMPARPKADTQPQSTRQTRSSSKKSKKPDENEGIATLERNAARHKTRDFDRVIPDPLVIECSINGQLIKALLDTGSSADFISTKIADQLKLPLEILAKPLPVQLAVSGSRGSVQASATVSFEYQGINCEKRFDVMNLDGYDAILGTPFMFMHQISIGFNPSKVAVGSRPPKPISGKNGTKIASRLTDVIERDLERLREIIKQEAAGLCKDAADTELPPLRSINHAIPLIDEEKTYGWRPSRCPEALRPLWNAKKAEYIKSGRWKIATGTNASPMLILKKKPAKDGSARIRCVVDKRQQNANTKKIASPLPDIESILRNVAAHKYRSIIDGKDAYEQIRVIPEHVPRTLFQTPDGTMVSLVLQQGDCNGGATYQQLMNHIFAPYIGIWMDVYLDDIVIYSDTIEDHLKHIRTILDILRREKLYLSADKMKFFVEEMEILGHIIDKDGIKIDPHKVDSIAKWKVPTNKSLLAGFLGTVSYIARGCKGIRIPMGVLSPLSGKNKPWKWGHTEQRAFEEIQSIVAEHRNVATKPIDDSPGAEPINLMTDASLTGGGGALTQGNDPLKGNYIAFWSGKFNPAQQSYPTHERELLAMIESLRRFRYLLTGRKFRLYTDHEALEWFDTQKDLSHRQQRWLRVTQEFDYTIEYIEGPRNVISDSLSRLYSNEPEGTVRASSEYVQDDTDVEGGRPTKMFRPPVHPLITGAPAAGMMGIHFGNDVPDDSPTPEEVAQDEGPDSLTPRRSKRERKQTDLGGTSKSVAIPGKPRKARSKKIDNEVIPDEPGDRETPHSIEPMVDKQLDEPETRLTTPDEVVPSLLQLATPDMDAIDVLTEVRNNYLNDTFFDGVMDSPERFRNYIVKDGLIYLDEEDRLLLCIPDVKVGQRRLRELIIAQAHSVMAHLGNNKTLLYIREEMWWPGMRRDVSLWCASCVTCSTTKSRTQPQYGLLKTLPVPTHPWQVIGIDFVGPLPASSNRNGVYDMLCVIIDHLTAMVHLVATKQTYRAKEVAELIFDHVYKLHGLPEAIVSDRDSLFTSTFWTTLHSLIGIKLKMSSAYHPQTDGATERANRTITQMLRQCIRPDQKDWVIKLPSIEFAINSARSDTTGFSPFYLNYGRLPYPMIWGSEKKYPGVRVFAQRMKDGILAAHDAIIEARVSQTEQANKKRLPAPFKEGDLVYLSTANLSLPKFRARKLSPKYIGPMKIIKVVSPGTTYSIELPPDLKRKGVHPTFHAQYLRPHVPNDDRRFPGRQMDQFVGLNDNPSEWKIDRIVSHYGRGRKAQFLTRWSTGDETWLDYRSLAGKEALPVYLELVGADSVAELPAAGPPADATTRDDVRSASVVFRTYKIHVDEGDNRDINTILLSLTRALKMAQPNQNTRGDSNMDGSNDAQLPNTPATPNPNTDNTNGTSTTVPVTANNVTVVTSGSEDTQLANLLARQNIAQNAQLLQILSDGFHTLLGGRDEGRDGGRNGRGQGHRARYRKKNRTTDDDPNIKYGRRTEHHNHGYSYGGGGSTAVRGRGGFPPRGRRGFGRGSGNRSYGPPMGSRGERNDAREQPYSRESSVAASEASMATNTTTDTIGRNTGQRMPQPDGRQMTQAGGSGGNATPHTAEVTDALRQLNTGGNTGDPEPENDAIVEDTE